MKKAVLGRGLLLWTVAAGVAALVLAAGGAVLAYWLSAGGWIGNPSGRSPAAAAEALKLGLTMAAGAGAAVALVVAFRRQRWLEEDREGARTEALAAALADRETRRATHERYQAATAQLGHDNLTIRLAGVYALAAVADDWLLMDDRAQARVCVDVLCSYLRTDQAEEGGPQPDLEVRQTITRVITAHLRDESLHSWRDFDLDFTGARFTGNHDFGHAHFTGGRVIFDEAQFTSGKVSFNYARFAGGNIFFGHAQFLGGDVSFSNAKFTDGGIVFYRTNFAAGTLSFNCAEFAAMEVLKDRSVIPGAMFSFVHAHFKDMKVTFDHARFTSGTFGFSGATFSGGKVSLTDAVFTGGRVSFDRVSLKGCAVYGPWQGRPPAIYPKRASTSDPVPSGSDESPSPSP